MIVRVNRVAAAVGIAGVILVVTSLAAFARIYYDDVPGKRRSIELESLRVFSSAFVRDLQSPDSLRAARAALALGRTKDRRALDALVTCSRNAADAGVRAMCAYGIGLVSDAARVPAAPVAIALDDPAAVVRAAAVDAAQRGIAARQPDAARFLPLLIGRMQHDADPIVRARAAVALAAYAPFPLAPTPSAPAAGAALAAAFAAEPNATVRWHEAWALGRAFPLAPAQPLIVKSLADPDELVRMAFVDVVAKRRDPRLARLIEPLRADPAWRVAEEAREGLRRLAGGKRTEHLRAIPNGVRTPPPQAPDPTPPLPRSAHLGPVRKPVAADADVNIALRVRTAASLDGPAPGPHPRVRIRTTKGDVVVRLYPEWAPLTVANFLNLTDRGYYDGLRWFRIVPNFVVQTGDRTNTGDGDAGYTIPAEENPLEQRAGVISMGLNYAGNSPIRDSAGTQFYITLSPQFHLNRAFTVFGEVERGFDVLGRLVESDRMIRVEQLAPD
jgi:cyclophilin family peptidyl-prolyl cis-trans isomerase/HEAT repeat protein